MGDIIVQKYGGSSVATTEKIITIAKRLIERKKTNPKIVVVVSAMGDTTDDYISLAKEITDTPDKRELDVLMSTGEMISASLLAMSLKSMGCDAISYNAYQLDIQTSGTHGKSLIDDIDVSKIEKSLDEGKIVVVTGFQGLDDIGDITTLGRGGSDTSAVALAVKLNGKCEIYTDVDGIYFTDPRKFKDAKKLEDKVITGLATSDDDVAITIDIDEEKIVDLFESIANENISMDMISQTAPINSSNITVSFTIPKEDLVKAKEIVSKYVLKNKIIIDENITKLSLVGLGMKHTSGVASKVFNILRKNGIKVKLITTSEIRITCAISSKDTHAAVQGIAREFNI